MILEITGCFIESSKNIAIVTPGFPSDELDTTCIPALQLFVEELSKQYANITVFSLHYPYRNEEYFWHGIKVVPLNGQNKFLRRKWMYPKLERKFMEQNQIRQFDILHAFWLNEATVFGLKLSRKMKIPLIATAMGQDVLYQNKAIKKINFSQVDAVITLSKFHQNEAEKSGILNSEIIPFGIKNQNKGSMEKTIDFVTIGNLIPLKQFDYFLALAADLKTKLPNFTAKVIGNGIHFEKLQRQITEYQLKENVELLGEQSYSTTQNILAQSKVLIHPSRFESFGMIFIEAMKVQTHVLASPVGIAFQENVITKLTFDIQRDANFAFKLLSRPLPKQKLYEISDTVQRYLEIYHRF